MKCAFDRTTFCIALTEKNCVGCAFHKTPEELDEGRERAYDRICNLPEEQQEHIAKKYRGLNYRANYWEEGKTTENPKKCSNCKHFVGCECFSGPCGDFIEANNDK